MIVIVIVIEIRMMVEMIDNGGDDKSGNRNWELPSPDSLLTNQQVTAGLTGQKVQKQGRNRAEIQ